MDKIIDLLSVPLSHPLVRKLSLIYSLHLCAVLALPLILGTTPSITVLAKPLTFLIDVNFLIRGLAAMLVRVLAC